MPSMDEIYERHAPEYHDLVVAEDYQHNLGRALNDVVDWDGKLVFEAGVGTGRVTRLYIDAVRGAVCCDRSPHMLDFAKRQLSDAGDRITFMLADNLDLPDTAGADIFIEGWSFGHSIVTAASDISGTALRLIRGLKRNLRPGGVGIILETLGTNVDEPAAPIPSLDEFYRLLEVDHGFTRLTLRTDYRFPSVEEAAQVTGFFFGPEMGRAVSERGSAVVPEWTGLWYRRDGWT